MDDIACFADGDMTLIGERGVTLSGGQKARVALARAVYRVAEIYLLDDPLSAVDMKVGREIFDNCVRGFLGDKIVVLVTHQIQYVRQADWIVVMREGSVCCQGCYEDVLKDEFCQEFLCDLEKIAEREVSKIQHCNLNETLSTSNTGDETEEQNEPLSKFLTQEDYRPYSSSIKTYVNYFLTGGLFATCVMLLLTILSYSSLFLSYWWMQSMSTCPSLFPSNNSTNNNFTFENMTMFCPWYMSVDNPASLGLIFFFVSFGSITNVLLGFLFYYTLIQASRRLHNRMLHRVMYCPMYFFDTNPSGRILNRFSTDMIFLDEMLPELFYYFWACINVVLFATIAAVIVQYYLLIPIVILLILTFFIRYYYLKTSTQVRRIECIARSPLYSHISLSLLGLSTIRALKIEERLTQDYHYYQDQHANAWYHHFSSAVWLFARLNLVSTLLAISGLVITLISYYVFVIDQLIGFIIPILLSSHTILGYFIKLSADVEIIMVSADRVFNYCGLLSEKTSASKLSLHSNFSNSIGEIEFINFSFKYSENVSNSLSNVSIRVLPGEKVGIIGRTGAGKSSLFNALCRLSEISEGCILIDRDDISLLDLYQHRKRISVIPQDPVLFSGTLRHNLDPFNEFTDQEVWNAISNCNLKSMVECMPEQLLSHVEEDGRNFSTGECQLLCLARAILRNNKLILIDEATANVDLHTDTLVQQAIRTHFSHCTVLTIAHRIDTIIDSDRIIVLDKSRVIEFEIPFLMLQNENSYLSMLFSHMDPYTQIKLKRLAEMSYNS